MMAQERKHMNCQVHNKEMKYNKKFGWSCPTPVEKDQQGNVLKWCDFKPQATQNTVASAPAQQFYQRQPSDWEKKVGKQKALCGMVNGLFAGGMKPEIITTEVMLKLNGIFGMIETASGVPASPAVKPVAQDEPPIEAYNENEAPHIDIPFA